MVVEVCVCDESRSYQREEQSSTLAIQVLCHSLPVPGYQDTVRLPENDEL